MVGDEGDDNCKAALSTSTLMSGPDAAPDVADPCNPVTISVGAQLA